MDILTIAKERWIEWVLNSAPALQDFLVKTGTGLFVILVFSALSTPAIRTPQLREHAEIARILIVVISVFTAIFMPIDWLFELQRKDDRVAIVSVAVSLFLFSPVLIPMLLIRTLGRQKLTRYLLFAVLLSGLILQIGISTDFFTNLEAVFP